MNTLLVLLKNNKLDIKTILKLFDRMVASIVLYSSELKGLNDYKEIDQIHLTFYKFLFGVKKKSQLLLFMGNLVVTHYRYYVLTVR